MLAERIDCYTDASYGKDVGGSYIGYKIGDRPVQLQYLEGVKNTQAEVIAVIQCVEQARALYPELGINVYTDCQKVILKLARPEGVEYYKVKGHRGGAAVDDRPPPFVEVDRATRRALRKARKELLGSEV